MRSYNKLYAVVDVDGHVYGISGYRPRANLLDLVYDGIGGLYNKLIGDAREIIPYGMFLRKRGENSHQHGAKERMGKDWTTRCPRRVPTEPKNQKKKKKQ